MYWWKETNLKLQGKKKIVVRNSRAPILRGSGSRSDLSLRTFVIETKKKNIYIYIYRWYNTVYLHGCTQKF
jgi:hypothetical protein